MTDVFIFFRAQLPLASQICFKWNYSINLDFSIFWTLTFTFVSQISLKISINLDFFVWSCVANLFKMPAKSNYIFVIIPHSWVFLIKTKCGFCCFLWKHTTKLDYGVGNVNKTENMEFARSDIGQEWIICQIW